MPAETTRFRGLAVLWRGNRWTPHGSSMTRHAAAAPKTSGFLQRRGGTQLG